MKRWLLGGLISLCVGASPAAALECEVLELSGSAQAVNAAGEVRELAKGDLVREEETLVTSGSNSVDLSFDRNWENIVHVEPSAKVKIVQVAPARLDLLGGGLYAQLKNLPKNSDFEVRTPTAVASVRGTEYRTVLEDSRTTVFNFSNSLVYVYEVSPEGARGASPQILTQSQKIVVTRSSGAARAVPMKLEEKITGENIAKKIEESVAQAVAEDRPSRIGTEKVEETGEQEPAESKNEESEDWESDREVAQSFSADMEMRGGAMGSLTATVRAVPGKARMDIPGSVSITRLDRGVVWVLLTEQKKYIEQSLSPEMAAQAASGSASLESRELVAEDPVEGQPAKKYRVKISANGQTQSLYQWMSPGKPVPVKMEAEDGSWTIIYRNIQLDKESEDLFEIPPGYERMDMPMLPQTAAEAADLQKKFEEFQKQQS